MQNILKMINLLVLQTVKLKILVYLNKYFNIISIVAKELSESKIISSLKQGLEARKYYL